MKEPVFRRGKNDKKFYQIPLFYGYKNKGEGHFFANEIGQIKLLW